MEFKNLLVELLASKTPLLATIFFKSHPFCDRLKNSPGVRLMMLQRDNHQELYECIMGELSKSR